MMVSAGAVGSFCGVMIPIVNPRLSNAVRACSIVKPAKFGTAIGALDGL